MLKQQGDLAIEYNRLKKERKAIKQKEEQKRAKRVKDEINGKSAVKTI